MHMSAVGRAARGPSALPLEVALTEDSSVPDAARQIDRARSLS